MDVDIDIDILARPHRNARTAGRFGNTFDFLMPILIFHCEFAREGVRVSYLKSVTLNAGNHRSIRKSMISNKGTGARTVCHRIKVDVAWADRNNMDGGANVNRFPIYNMTRR